GSWRVPRPSATPPIPCSRTPRAATCATRCRSETGRRRGPSGGAARLGVPRGLPAPPPATGGRGLLGPAVPQRVGEPHLPRPVRRDRPRRTAATVRHDRHGGARHAPRVQRAVAAARGLPASAARAPLL